MTITLETIRAAGGIVHSDGNIFFRDISMLEVLAGAAPAAVAGPAIKVPEDWMEHLGFELDAPADGVWMVIDDTGARREANLTERILWKELIAIRAAIQDAALAPAAPALEAPAAPAGWKLVPEKPTDAMLGAAQKAWLADPLRRSSTVYAAALAAAPALEAPAAPAVPPLTPDEARWAARSADRMRGPSDVTSGTEYAMAGAMALAKKLAAAPQAPAAPVEFQQRVQPWMMACFGAEIAADRAERNHRFLEESLELVQSCGCTASEAHQLVNYVFGRPVGEPAQEVGGVMVTLAALCLANSLDMHAAGETELARIWGKVEQIRAKQAAKPKHSPLPAAPAAPAVDDERAAYVAFLTGEFPGMYSQAEAERWWDQRHVSAETWKAARASANGAKA